MHCACESASWPPQSGRDSAAQKDSWEIEAHWLCTAFNIATGRIVMATIARTKRVAVMLGDGTNLAEVEPNGIENHQV
jgi:hypothetical protein